MPPITNPYFAGPPARHPDTFFGRRETLRFVDDTLASPMHNVIVFYGQRRIGKTSILHQIAQRQNQAYRPVFFDFQSNIDSAAPHLFYDLARTITHELELPPPDPARFQNDPHAFQTTFLPMIHQVLGQDRLLLLLDEFDAISLDPNTAELDTSPFVRALNRIIQGDDKRVIFLFVVGRRLKDLASQQLQIFRGARDRQIGLLKQEDARQLIIRPAEELLTYYEAAIERVWALTSGQPYFIQSLCHELFNRAKRAGTWTVTATDVDAVIDEAISASQSALRWFWDEVPPIERFTLYTIGQLTTETQGVTLDQLVAQRDAQQVRVPDFELRDLPDKLVDRQVLRRVSPERYQFAVEMVRRWIIQSHSLEEVTTELTRAAISDLAKALFKTGQAAFRAGDSHLALDNFSRAISIDANYVEARLWLARAYLATGDLLAAINEFVNVERFGGLEQGEARLGLADARAKYGRQLEEKGQLDEAKQEYERVLELDPKHPAANMHLGEMVRQGGDQQLDDQGVEAARPFYEQAARYNPELKYDITERLNSYSQTQVEAKNWQEAEQASRLADKLMSTTGSQEALLDVQLRWGRWQLEHHHLEAATELYRRLLRESDNETSRQVIKNDILRYSREQEEQHQWGRAETVLALLVEWFPDDPEHASRLQDHLCRQAEYYLGQGEFAKAEVTYRRILANALSDQTLRGMIKAGFQAYQRTRLADEHLETRQQVVQAMTLLIEILDERDPTAYQWRAEARKALGDGLRKAKKRTEAKAVYQQAQEDLNRATELTIESDPVQYPYKPEIQFSLGLLALDEAKFDAATAHFKQALAEIDDPAAMAGRTKTALNAYRQQQEQQHQWPQAHRAIEMLADLFPDDDQIRLWQAELNVALAGWHLQRAIPDLDEAQRLAYTALDTVSSAQKETIAAKIKDVFKTRSDHQEQTTPPAWEQAEQMLNRLVSLIPDDPLVHRWLGESRMRQGDWYLSQAEPVVLQAEEYLTSATQVYRRALNDASGDLYLITHLKKSFRDYHQRYRTSTSPLAVQAMLMLAELLPHDEEVQRWTYEKPAPASWLERVRQQPALSAAIAGGVFLLCAGVLFLWPNGSFGGLIAAISPQTPTPTVTPTAPPSPTATLAQPNTPVFTTSTDTATLSPTETPTSTPLPTATLLPPSPTPIPTETPTTSPTDPLTPTLIPSPTPFLLPQLTFPEDGAGFAGATSPPELAWEPTADLGEDEYYLIKLEYLGPDDPETLTWHTKETSWQLDTELFQQINLADREVTWQVVVAEIPGDDNSQATLLSDPSEKRTFTWDRRPLPNGDGLDIALNPQNSVEIYALLRGDGIYKSVSGGTDWTRIREESTVETVHIAPANPNVIYAGAFARVSKSEDGGATWDTFSFGPSVQVFDLTTDPDNADIVFAATDKGIVGSQDGAETWTTFLNAGPTGNQILEESYYNIVSVRTSGSNRVYVAGTGDQIYWRGTTDTGSPWQIEICTACSHTIYALAIDNNTLLAGGDENRLAVSPNLGDDWERADVPASPNKIKFSTLVFDPFDSQVVYAGSGTPRNPSDSEGLYRSVDGGQSWDFFNDWVKFANPERTYIQSIAIDPTDNRVIFIAGSGGVFRTEDGGRTWSKQ